MNDDERYIYNEKKRLYYRKEAINVLQQILPMKKV